MDIFLVFVCGTRAHLYEAYVEAVQQHNYGRAWFESRLSHRLSCDRGSSWFSSVSPGKWRNNTSIMPPLVLLCGRYSP
jgi:hypothetical protein